MSENVLQFEKKIGKWTSFPEIIYELIFLKVRKKELSKMSKARSGGNQAFLLDTMQ